MLERVFHLKERGSNVKSELLGGFITFLSIIYILPVNAAILSNMGINSGGVFFATALLSCLCCVLIGILANYPVALSAGMGMNAYLAYTICTSMGFDWIETMMLLTVNGILFLILTITPLRAKIIASMPKGLSAAICIGLGGFIMFVGLQGGGLIVTSSTLVTLGDFNSPATLLSTFGILLTIGLMALKKVPALSKMAIPIGLFITTVVGVIASLSLTAAGRGDYAFSSGLPIAPWDDPSIYWGVNGFDKVIFYGVFDSANANVDYGAKLVDLLSNVQTYIAVFTLIFVNMFDTTATLISTGRGCNLVDEKGNLIGGQRAMLADAMGAVLAGPLGTSTVTSFAESSIGVSLGARTGLAAITVGACFLLSGFAFPIFSVFSYPSVYSVALVAVGLLIMSSNLPALVEADKTTLFAGILTFIMMILTYSLSNGLAIGVIAYVLIKLFEGKYKEISITLYILSVVFLAFFMVTALTSHL